MRSALVKRSTGEERRESVFVQKRNRNRHMRKMELDRPAHEHTDCVMSCSVVFMMVDIPCT